MATAPHSSTRHTQQAPVLQLQPEERTTIQRTPLVPLPLSSYPQPGLSHHRTSRTAAYRAFKDDNPAFIRNMAELRKYKSAVMARLSAMPRQRQRSEIRRLLTSKRLARFYAYRAVLRAGLISTATPASIDSIAKQCTPFVHSREQSRWHHVAKGGKIRLVQNFRPIKRMMQALVADIILAIHPPRTEQYLYRGGIPAALKAADAAFDDGYTHAVEVDAVNFYGSLSHHSLARLLLPLPAAVAYHVVCNAATLPTSSPSATMGMHAISPPPDDLFGIPLGASSSPIAGEAMIANLLAAAEAAIGCKIITYADNLLVFGRSAQDATVNAEHLLTLATSQPIKLTGHRGRGLMAMSHLE